jgi:hypothetical protein
MLKLDSPVADAALATVDTSAVAIESLVDRSGDLKGELVAFAQSPRFAKQLKAQLRSAADGDGCIDEAAAVRVIDRFALQHRLSNGRTLLEQFVRQRRPPLSDNERDMLLGWREVIEGCFEIRGLDHGSALLHNLVDDLVYRVYSNIGPDAFAPIREGVFVLARIVPVHPATDAWLVSGHLSCFPESDGRQIAQAVVQSATGHPELARRNPDLVRRAWERQAEHRADFIAQVGSDLVVLPPGEAQEVLREHYRRIQGKAVAGLSRKAAKRGAAAGPTPEEMGRLPDDLLGADSVAVIYDEVDGLCLYHDFGRLDALFADPSLGRDRTYLRQLDGYLRDDSVSPLAIRRLVQRHPDGADPVFRALLHRPGFCWEQHGERLLRRHKKSFFDREPTPSIFVIGSRLAELLGVG